VDVVTVTASHPLQVLSHPPTRVKHNPFLNIPWHMERASVFFLSSQKFVVVVLVVTVVVLVVTVVDVLVLVLVEVLVLVLVEVDVLVVVVSQPLHVLSHSPGTLAHNP